MNYTAEAGRNIVGRNAQLTFFPFKATLDQAPKGARENKLTFPVPPSPTRTSLKEGTA